MTELEISDVIVALRHRINYIETGTIILSAEDARQRNRPELIKPLEPSQLETIDRLKKLIGKFERLLVRSDQR